MNPQSARIAVLAAVTWLVASPASAEGIHAESLLPASGVGAEFSWAGSDTADIYELMLRGGYQAGAVGTEIFIPLGWYAPQSEGEPIDSKFGVGNIGLAGRAGTNMDLGVFSLELAGAFTAYIPTATEEMNSFLTGLQLLRPGLRTREAVPIEFAVSAALQAGLFETTGTFGATVIFPTDGDTQTYSWLHAGIAFGVAVVPMLKIVAEYAVAARTGVVNEDMHQISAGLQVDVAVVQVGLNARIPVGGEQLSEAPVVLGFDARVGW